MSRIQFSSGLPPRPLKTLQATRFAATSQKGDDGDDLLALHRLEKRDGKLDSVEVGKGLARDAATQLQILALILMKSNQMKEASKVISMSNDLYECILAKDPTGVNGNQVMRAQLLEGQIKLFEGQTDQAQKLIQQARDYFEKKDEKSLEMAEIFDLLEKIYKQMGGRENKKEAGYFADRAKIIRKYHGIKSGWFS